MTTLLHFVLLGCLGCAAASDMPDGLPQSPSIADAMKDPAVVEQAMKMMQNPMVMQQMRVMMQDPRVKERMQRMLERLGGDTGLEGADGLANDPAALDKLFERMQDPAVLEKVAALAKNESFQAKVQQLAQNDKFTEAAGQYAAEMKDDVISDHKMAEELGLDTGIETGDDVEDEDGLDAEDEA